MSPSPEAIAAAAVMFVALAELNSRPRKTLAWKTPAQALNELLLQ